jgi:hypothetical protein
LGSEQPIGIRGEKDVGGASFACSGSSLRARCPGRGRSDQSQMRPSGTCSLAMVNEPTSDIRGMLTSRMPDRLQLRARALALDVEFDPSLRVRAGQLLPWLRCTFGRSSAPPPVARRTLELQRLHVDPWRGGREAAPPEHRSSNHERRRVPPTYCLGTPSKLWVLDHPLPSFRRQHPPTDRMVVIT